MGSFEKINEVLLPFFGGKDSKTYTIRERVLFLF